MVAGNQVIGFSINTQRKQKVVFRVPAQINGCSNFHHFAIIFNYFKKISQIFKGEILSQFGSADDFHELSQQFVTEKNLTMMFEHE